MKMNLGGRQTLYRKKDFPAAVSSLKQNSPYEGPHSGATAEDRVFTVPHHLNDSIPGATAVPGP
jgi:hypothetical protein